MNKQTAVDWFLDKINNSGDLNKNEIDEIIAKAKEMEKEQIIDDIVQFGIKYHHKYSEGEIKRLCENAEEYYNETYKNETK